MIADALPDSVRSLVIGSIQHQEPLEIPERHLGLVTIEENETKGSDWDEASEQAAERLDIDRLIALAGVRDRAIPQLPTKRPTRRRRARIGVAQDQAFCFYYEENLLLLREAGFEVVPFRPTSDRRLPDDVNAIYLGGGYPESFAVQLAANTTLRADLRARAADGMPIYAECGGLMYLGRSLTGFDGARHAMSGVLPLDVVMDRDYLAISYVEVRTRSASPLGSAGTTIRGQEFHQSRIVDADIEPMLYDVTTSDGRSHRAGYLRQNVIASYVHLHFGSNPQVVNDLVRASIEPS